MKRCIQQLISKRLNSMFKDNPVHVYYHIHKSSEKAFYIDCTPKTLSSHYKIYQLHYYKCILCSHSSQALEELILHLKIFHINAKIRYSMHMQETLSKAYRSIHIFIYRNDVKESTPKCNEDIAMVFCLTKEFIDEKIKESHKEDLSQDMKESIVKALEKKETLKIVNRKYYHSKSSIPFSEKEITRGEDSEGEDDFKAMRCEIENNEIDEFVDLCSSDKKLFKLWNRQVYLQMKSGKKMKLRDLVMDLVVGNKAEILEMEENFHFLLLYLFENNLLRSEDVEKIENEYDKIKGK